MHWIGFSKKSLLHEYKRVKLWAFQAIFFSIGITQLSGQCSTSGTLNIPDDDTVIVQFIVTGLADSVLASPTQGICGINLDFMHEYLGDLTITLISPSGIRVELVGPVTTAITPTNLSRWNIRFVPCMSPALPDAGFTPVWSNLQSWDTFTPYSGSYYPYSGCLEDFNSGSANGVWQLIIEDHDIFQTGTLADATLLFCNPTGLKCAQCNPNGGTLTPGTISRCIGQNISSSDITVDYGINPPLPGTYSYQFMMTLGNTIVRSGTFFSDIPSPGNYSICGLSYLTVDSMKINNLLATGDYNQVIQGLNSGSVCAARSSNCVSLHVLPLPDTTYILTELCKGEVYTFGGQDYSVMGTYYQTHDGPGLCDSVFQIRIVTSALDIDFILPDSLHCMSGAVIVNSTIAGNTGVVAYAWSTLSGNIIGPTNLSFISVDQPGQYFLSVSDDICTTVESINVFADQGYPQVFIQDGEITCSNPMILLDPVYIPTDATLLWTGPSGFTSGQAQINVSVPGNYFLKVTNQSGCSITKRVTVTIDTSTIDFQIVQVEKNCQAGYVTLGSSNETFVNWNWSGPNNFSSDIPRPNISLPGNYALEATFINGCKRTQNYLFDGDFAIPDITASPGDTIHCNEVLTLSVSSSTPGTSYIWSGPEGFYRESPTIQIDYAGVYNAIVIAPNGCYAVQEVPIERGDDIFDYQIISDTPTCAKDTVEIGVIAAEADLFKWINVANADSLSSFIKVSSSGIYTVMVTDTNSGCEILLQIRVLGDFTPPNFGFIPDTITCNHPVAHLIFAPYPGFDYTNIFWELPDQTIVPGPQVLSSQTGEHRLYGIGPNGCTGIRYINIPFDTIKPSLFLEAEILGCDDTVKVTAYPLIPVPGYQWSGPGIVSTNGPEINVNEAGIYDLLASGLNGCSAAFSILVDSNFVIPSYELNLDTLRCDTPASLIAHSPDTLASYKWSDLAGGIISNDSIALVNSPGSYIVEIRGMNNCLAHDTVVLDPPQFPSIGIVADTLTCAKTTVTVSGSSNANPSTFQWTDINGNVISVSDKAVVADTGPYFLSVTAQNGCETLDTIIIPIDTIAPEAMIELIGEIRCQLRDIIFDGNGSSPVDIDFLWTTEGGIIKGDHSLPRVEARDTGLYILTVIRRDNGCADRDSFLLTEHPDAISLVLFETTPPACSGDANAAIHIIDLQGGIPPLLYQLDGGVLQSMDVFDGLQPGQYLLNILDAAGCLIDTMVTIEDVDSFHVNAGDDVEIFIGDSITLTGISDLQPSDIFGMQWDSLDVVFCHDCSELNVSPQETSTYHFTVTSKTGCIRSDEVTVFVIEKGKYFIGNIFSPNGDGSNDVLRLHTTSGISRVLKWIIFDRSGNAVFGKTDFVPNDSTIYWDGHTGQGAEVNPAVFAYILEVELLNGKIEIYHGDITLIR